MKDDKIYNWDAMSEKDRSRLLAEKVAGWKWYRFPSYKDEENRRHPGWCQLINPAEKWYHRFKAVPVAAKAADLEDFTDTSCFKPTSNALSALALVPMLQAKGFEFACNTAGTTWEARFTKLNIEGSAKRKTLAEAICLAALAALGIKVKYKR